MAVIRVSASFAATVPEAERCWYDTARWHRWVEGLDQVLSVADGWPATGEVRWESGPAGRGQVTERVLAYEPLAGQTVAVSDEAIEAEQTVSFTPDGRGVEVALALAYRLRRRSPLMAIVDLLFIRRAMSASLAATLEHFGAELEAT